jgi:hypothetical protein
VEAKYKSKGMKMGAMFDSERDGRRDPQLYAATPGVFFEDFSLSTLSESNVRHRPNKAQIIDDVAREIDRR